MRESIRMPIYSKFHNDKYYMKNFNFLRYLLTFIIFFCAATGQAESTSEPHFYFKQLSQLDGLSQNYVRAITMDHNGFYWIGTRSGLNRFDGYEFIRFYHDSSDSLSLPGNLIQYVVEDNDNNLWVSTSDGLCLMDRKSGNFKRMKYKNGRFLSHSYLKTDTAIYFGGDNLLLKWNRNSKTLEPVKIIMTDQKPRMITHIVQWTNRYWVIGTRWNGLWLLDLNSRKLVKADFCSYQEISSIFVDSKQRLWISPFNQGVKVYSTGRSLLRQFNSESSFISNNIILDIEERKGEIWLATDGGGISIINSDTGKGYNINHNPSDISSFPFNSIFTLYKDENDNMWAGTIRGGFIGIKEVGMHTYNEVPFGNNYGLSNRTMLCAYEDNHGLIWIGTDGGGINSFDPATQTFHHFKETYGCKVGAIAPFDDNRLVVFIFSKGLFLFDRTTGTLSRFLSDEQNRQVSNSPVTTNLISYKPGKILFITDNVFIYDTNSKEMEKIKFIDEEKPSGAMEHIYSNENISYTFSPGFILKIDHNKKTAHHIYRVPSNNTGIYAAACDDHGNIWIGTNQGLFRLNIATGKTEKISTNLFREVTALVYDNNSLWIGANNALLRYDIAHRNFMIYGESDGAEHNEYLNRCAFVARNGNIFLGGINGLLYINKNFRRIQDTGSFHSKISLADIVIDGVSAFYNSDSESIEYEVERGFSTLSLKVIVREEDIFRSKIFRFYIDDVESEPIETFNHTLELHGLPIGSHDIYVSCSEPTGSWSEPVKVATIRVLAPWWMSWWFITLLILIIGGIVWFMGFYYLLRKRNKMLLDLKDKEKQISEDKVRFLINISHELRTPLTLIYAPLKILLQEYNEPDSPLNRQLQRIFKQTRLMLNLINMVLDMRRMEAGFQKLHLQQHPLNKWIETIVNDFTDEYKSKNMTLTFIPGENITNVPFDKEKCDIVLSNLLMNAYKYSDEDTEVVVTSEIIGENVRISVRDQGIGLTEKDLSNLFSRFYQGDHQIGGSGIGLAYSKTLLELHKGKIGAFNNPDKGATFWIELPLHADEETISCSSGDYLPVSDSSENNNKRSDLNNNFNMSAFTLLIVDDEKEVRSFIAETLKDKFKRIYTASNGAEALEQTRNHQPDIVVSDIMMPKMDGYEFCQILKSDIRISHIPVVLLTAQHTQNSSNISYKLGADAYLAKPFDIDTLLSIIRNILRSREQIKSYYRNLSNAPKTIEEQTISNADEQFMMKLNKIIQDNIANTDLDVKFLTLEVGMSRASLYNKVKSITGLGVNDYVNRLKIEQAMRLLETTDLSITEVSEKTGFSSARYFSTLFKQFTQETPSTYKASQKKGTKSE